MPPNNSQESSNQPVETNQQPATNQQAAQPVDVNVNLNLQLSESERQMLDPDEHVVTIVYRTVVGIVLIYLEALAAVVALLALVVLAFPDLFSELSSNSNILLVAAAVFAIALVFFMLFIATYLYRQSKLIVTDKNLIQILQRGLFARKVSRLSMSNVEDVTADSSGFLPTIFGYGTLTVETAGEQTNFVFPYCPNPNMYADRILDARQAYANRLQEND